MSKVYTSRDAARERQHAEYLREHNELSKRVRKWACRVDRDPTNLIALDTYNRLSAELAAL